MPSRRAILLGLSSATLALALSAHAQDRPQVFTIEDRDVEDALAKAESLEKQGQFGPAGEEYAKLELLLDRKREKDPEARFVSSVGPSLDRGVVSILRDRVRALPEDGIAAYRTLADAKARAALEAALESGEAEALELVAERWALTSSANPALRALAASAFERGDLARAERAYARLERSPEASKDEARRFAYLRLLAAAGRGDAASAADALASFE